MSWQELQQEELEVLRSIYEGDTQFKIVNDTTFQYKIGEDGSQKSFLIEIKWIKSYPSEPPIVNMETFYNKHILKEIKESVVTSILEQTEQLLDSAMTYSLIEWVKENADSLMENQPDQPVIIGDISSSIENVQIADQQPIASASSKDKKVHLTKAQKRKLYDRLDCNKERPRGWDWIDVVKHLSQTGGGSTAAATASYYNEF